MIGGILRFSTATTGLEEAACSSSKATSTTPPSSTRGQSSFTIVPHDGADGVEFDHADIYRDLEHVEEQPSAGSSRLPPGSLLMACDGDPIVDAVLAGTTAAVRRYGQDAASDWRLGAVAVRPALDSFEVLNGGVASSFPHACDRHPQPAERPGGRRRGGPRRLSTAEVGPRLVASAGSRGARRCGARARHRGDRRLRAPSHGGERNRSRACGPHIPGRRSLPCSSPGPTPACARSFRAPTRRPSTGPTLSASAGLPCWRRSRKPTASPRRRSRRISSGEGKSADSFEDTDGILEFIVADGLRPVTSC